MATEIEKIERKAAVAATRDGWGILNPQGNMWTPEIFDTKEQAERHFAKFWLNVKGAPDWSQYRAVWCRQRTAPIREPKRSRALSSRTQEGRADG